MKILKSIALVLFFSLITNSVSAQGWGVRAGVNFSSASDGNFLEIDSQNGGYVGLYKQFSIIPKLVYIQPEVQFSKQGFETTFSDFDLSYIQVPIMAKVYFLKVLSFEAGPQFGFLVDDNVKGLDLDYDFNTIDTAWAVGMSINLPLGLSINGRYIASFNEAINNYDSKNQVFQLGAGLKF